MKYVVTSCIIAVGAGMVVPLMAAWLRLQYDISDAVSGPILGISSLVTGVATLVAPLLAKRFGFVKAITVTRNISIVFMFTIPFSPNYISAGFAYTLSSLLMNMANPLEQSLIMGIVIEDERGVALGVSSALWSLPNALSSFVGAWFMGLGLLAAPFFLTGLLYAFSIALFRYYFRNTRVPEELIHLSTAKR